jgi:Holliday junction resolvase-like predicted endonuclease
MDIIKSSRHSKIAGDFGEALVLYWLSKHGFECARVDHTGIDLIARNPHTSDVMGISIKSRTRISGAEGESITIPRDDFTKIEAACSAFGCTPYFAIVVDADKAIRVFITSLAHLVQLHPLKSAGSYWKMSDAHLTQYSDDPEIMTFELRTDTKRWWSMKTTPNKSLQPTATAPSVLTEP